MNRGLRIAAAGLASATLVVATSAAAGRDAGSLVPPAACDPAVVIPDSEIDGHHQPTDVLRAWLSEEDGGNLQAVIEVDLGNWDAEHDEEQIVAGYVFLFTVNGVTRFVRLSSDVNFEATYDYGTYTFPNTFESDGPTTGRREPEPMIPQHNGNGTAVIDVPTTVANDGDLLTDVYVLTYDGIVGGPHNPPTWVDHAPGGERPVNEATDPRGPSFLVGDCAGVRLKAPGTITGSRRVTISGRLIPTEDDVPVEITREAPNATFNTTTAADGTFSIQILVRETTDVEAVAQATAGQIGSLTRTIRVRSKVTITAKHLRSGKVKIKGVTRPALPGRVQLFKTTAFFPRASKQIGGGMFSFSPVDLRPGRYEVIYTPRNGRAVRDISNKVRAR